MWSSLRFHNTSYSHSHTVQRLTEKDSETHKHTHTPNERERQRHTHTLKERDRDRHYFPGASSSLRHDDKEILPPNHGSTVTKYDDHDGQERSWVVPTHSEGTPGNQSVTSPGRVGGGLVRGGVALVSWEKEGWRGPERLSAGMTPRTPHSRPFLHTVESISTSSLPFTERSSRQDRIRKNAKQERNIGRAMIQLTLQQEQP
jgi:hypothetical protein